MASDVRICHANRHLPYLIVSHSQFHVTPIRAILVHARTADVEWKPEAIDVLGGQASGHARERSAASLTSSPCRLTDQTRSRRVPAAPCQLSPAEAAGPTSLQTDTSGVAWAGRGRIQRTVLGRDTSTRACCPVLGSQRRDRLLGFLHPALHHVVPGLSA